MKNHEQKIKEFMSDEKKLKALLTDEIFIGKVAGGEATPETYQEEIRKLGLELSIDEAAQIQNTVNKIFETPAEKLEDEFLKQIAGGKRNDNASIDKSLRHQNDNAVVAKSSKGSTSTVSAGDVAGTAFFATLGASALAGCGCAIAAFAYEMKGNAHARDKCGFAATALLGVPVLIAWAGMH